MIAGKAAGVIDDLAQHARRTAIVEGFPLQPDPERHLFYQPLVAKYIQMEEMLDAFFKSKL